MRRTITVSSVAVIIATSLAMPSSVFAQQGRIVEVLPKPIPRPSPPLATRPAPVPAPVSTPVDAGQTAAALRRRYADLLAGAANCDAFAKVAPTVEDGRIIAAAATRETKGEFESSDEFIARYSRGIIEALGGAGIFVIRMPASSTDIGYDADRGLFVAAQSNIKVALGEISCSGSYCLASPLGVEWKMSGNSSSLEFEVPRIVAESVKREHYFVVGVPISQIRMGRKPYGSGFDMTISGLCVVLVSGETSYLPNRSFWFDRSNTEETVPKLSNTLASSTPPSKSRDGHR